MDFLHHGTVGGNYIFEGKLRHFRSMDLKTLKSSKGSFSQRQNARCQHENRRYALPWINFGLEGGSSRQKCLGGFPAKWAMNLPAPPSSSNL